MGRFRDLSGQTFGLWTAIRYEGDSKWLCRCICGVERSVKGATLVNGSSSCCGCVTRKNAGLNRRMEIVGQRFNRLLCIEMIGLDKHGHSLARFKCDCGNETILNASGVKGGRIKSCGCLVHEPHGNYPQTQHGLCNSTLYRRWSGARNRCNNPTNKAYPNYGGRGIKMCEEWDSNFLAFYDWALSNGYSKDLSLDRIDNDGPYSPENCRWADVKTQGNNRRTNVYISFDGKTQTLHEWADEYDLDYQTLHRRISKGWDFMEALTTPMKKRGP